MKTYFNPNRKQQGELINRPNLNLENLNTIVKKVFLDVHKAGDKGVLDYTKKFDKISYENLCIDEVEINFLASQTEDTVKKAIDAAYENINKFHMANADIADKKVETTPGVICWQEVRPIEKVGLYVPGGSAPLISTALMLGIPAVLVGCKNIIVCTPPNKLGKVEPAICYVAKKLGVKKIFCAGGIQAIAAMSVGTETIPKVDKIFGPGNQYVMAAKQYAINFGVAIDMPAGPSEVMVIADDSARSDYVAADLLSQAEHGPDSQVVLIAKNKEIANSVKAELKKQLSELPRAEIAKKSLKNSFCIILKTQEAMIDFANIYAPEHLIINTKNPDSFVSEINNAGSVFLGAYTPESAGDYASGTNHTLPTSGWAKTYSGLSVKDFQKIVTFQKITKNGIKNLSGTIITLARAEGLEAHAKAVEIRN